MKSSIVRPIPRDRLALISAAVSTVLLISLTLVARGAPEEDQAAVTEQLKQLGNGDPDVQLDALRELTTSLDPRIPDACLPLLKSGGDSVRRIAARAIGSRWQQIPAERVPIFVKALKKNLDSDKPGEANTCRRGIGLLERTYANSMFSRSSDKRWVIYERFKKPCLIDTRNQTEEILGPDVEGDFFPAYSNREVLPYCIWHPKEEMAAMTIQIFRWPREIWIWKHATGLRPMHVAELVPLLKPAKGEVLPGAAFEINPVGWNGLVLEFTANYATADEEQFTDHTATLNWDSTTDQVRLIGDKVEGIRKITPEP
jgi:hypothetical protein